MAELFNRWQGQLWHGEVFPVVSQQGQIVMEGDCGNRGICQRKGMPLPARLATSTLVLTTSVTAGGVADCADLLSGGGTDSVFAILAP